MPPSTSSGHQYFKSQSAFLRPARSDEWRVIGAFHKPKSALVSSSPLTLSSRCLCIWIVIWTTKSDTDAICEQISSCSDLLILSHHQWWFIISSNSYCGRQVMAGICTIPSSQVDGKDRSHKWSRKYIKLDHNDMNGMRNGPINWPPPTPSPSSGCAYSPIKRDPPPKHQSNHINSYSLVLLCWFCLCLHIISDKFSFKMITAAEQLSDFSSSSSIRNSTSPPLSVWEWPLLRKHSCYFYYTPIYTYTPIHYTPIHLYTILRKITPGLPLTTLHLPHILISTSTSTNLIFAYLPPPKRYHLPPSPPLSGLASPSFAHIHQPLLMP